MSEAGDESIPRLGDAGGAAMREAIAAAREDLPSERRVRALLAASIASASALGGASAAAATAGSVKLAAMFVAGTLLAGAAGGAVVVAMRTDAPATFAPAPRVVEPASRVVEPAPPLAPPSPLVAAPAAPAAADAPARRSRVTVARPAAAKAAATPSVPASVAAAATPNRSAASALLDEARLVEAARAKVASDPGEALRIVGRVRAEHPAGALAQEADVVAIEALVRAGRASDAARAAAEFVQRYPGSPHRGRVEAVVGATR